MYAIIETGAKQYKVSKGDVLEVERLAAKEGQEVKLEKVLNKSTFLNLQLLSLDQ